MVVDPIFVGSLTYLTLKNAVPLILASCGEVISERAGVINLGVEGSMLMGALIGVITTFSTGNVWVGLLVGGLAGSLLALLHGLIVVVFGGNQIVSGIAITMLGAGLTSLLGRWYVGKSLLGLRPPPIYPYDIPGPDYIRPILASILRQDLMVFIAILIPIAINYMLFKTKLGSAIRACGENPVIAEALGVNVLNTRLLAIGLGGFLAGLGGAYLSLGVVGSWVENLSAGMGWIAVGLVPLAMWVPARTLLTSYFMAMIIAISYILQGRIGVSSFFLVMIPYITTIVILTIVSIEKFRIRLGAPAALGKPYLREERLG